MTKLLPFLLIVVFATSGFAQAMDNEVPLPVPEAPPAIQPPAPPQQPPETVIFNLGYGETTRFKSHTYSFRPPFHLRNLSALRITCLDSRIKIKRALITYSDGRMQEVTDLMGEISAGETMTTYLYGSPIDLVTVIAGNSSVFRKKGLFQVDASIH